MVAPCIVWFRQDLRLNDNYALAAAVQRGVPVIPLFIWAPKEEGHWQPGGASKVWIHRALECLSEDLKNVGSKLIVREGASLEVLKEIIEQSKSSALYFNERYEPAVAARDAVVIKELRSAGIDVGVFNSALLFEPDQIRTKDGNPYKVFTPFWKACLTAEEPHEPLSAPRQIEAPEHFPRSSALKSLELLPRIKWDSGIKSAWIPGQEGVTARLEQLLKEVLPDYSAGRNRPDFDLVSKVSPYLHSGELSPRMVWHAVKKRATKGSDKFKSNAATYLKELGWREFAYHLLVHFPETAEQPLRKEFKHFPWENDESKLHCWQRGMTGFPIVDAGMRQLWTTGWMHNRVRMIVASFLVKDLLIPWQEGAKWFWDTLVDADLANNTLGWQWSAGCGADAAPYFRIFNPTSQAEKFDPEGDYIRQWVPELRDVPGEFIHNPSAAPLAMAQAGITLGEDYPYPIVDHSEARRRALAALSTLKAVKSS